MMQDRLLNFVSAIALVIVAAAWLWFLFAYADSARPSGTRLTGELAYFWGSPELAAKFEKGPLEGRAFCLIN
jgi:hypothetical protein